MIKKQYDIFFTTLANRNRLKIINTLRKKDMNVTEIIKSTGLNQTTVSHNLQRLWKCGFVSVQRKGKFKYYKINRNTIEPLMKLIDKHINKYCSKNI